MQAAIDAAALAVGREGASMDEAGRRAFAQATFEANFPQHERYGSPALDMSGGPGQVVLSAAAKVPTSFMGVLGIDEMPVGALSEAVWGENPIELALVLDNTGSMRQSGRMETLKESVHALLEILEENRRDPDAVRISVIPFDVQVRIDTLLRDEPWLLMPEPSRGEGRKKDKAGKGRKGSDAFEWQGCIADRDQPYDASADPYEPARREQTGYRPVECYSGTLTSILPLTVDFSAVRRTVGDMQPGGNTNVTIGIVWGIASLVPHAPLPETRWPAKDDLNRVMIVLTDGDNTENRWGRNPTAMDTRTRLACRAAKAEGITVYAVRVVDGNENLIRDCASDPSKYFDVQQVDQLLPTFKAMATDIAKLRLAQ